MSENQSTLEVKISALKPFQERFHLVFKVVEKSEIREVGNRNNPDERHKLSDYKVADETGAITLTAWDDDATFLEVGNYYKLSNGYVNVFRDSMRLGRGKFGKLEATTAVFEANISTNRSSETHEGKPRIHDFSSEDSSYSQRLTRKNEGRTQNKSTRW